MFAVNIPAADPLSSGAWHDYEGWFIVRPDTYLFIEIAGDDCDLYFDSISVCQVSPTIYTNQANGPQLFIDPTFDDATPQYGFTTNGLTSYDFNGPGPSGGNALVAHNPITQSSAFGVKIEYPVSTIAGEVYLLSLDMMWATEPVLNYPDDYCHITLAIFKNDVVRANGVIFYAGNPPGQCTAGVWYHFEGPVAAPGATTLRLEYDCHSNIQPQPANTFSFDNLRLTQMS